jgi:flagellar basal body rod protein FlgF
VERQLSFRSRFKLIKPQTARLCQMPRKHALRADQSYSLVSGGLEGKNVGINESMELNIVQYQCFMTFTRFP